MHLWAACEFKQNVSKEQKVGQYTLTTANITKFISKLNYIVNKTSHRRMNLHVVYYIETKTQVNRECRVDTIPPKKRWMYAMRIICCKYLKIKLCLMNWFRHNLMSGLVIIINFIKLSKFKRHVLTKIWMKKYKKYIDLLCTSIILFPYYREYFHIWTEPGKN